MVATLFRNETRYQTIIKAITEQELISMDSLRQIASTRFGDMIKAVVDLTRGIMIIDADLHSDEEAELLTTGSRQHYM